MPIRCVLTPTTVRNFPNVDLPATKLASIDAALNERFSFQAALRTDVPHGGVVKVSAAAPDGWTVRVRRVGFVPVQHHNTPVLADPLDTDGIGQIPGYVPDPLFDEDSVLLPQDETNSFWFTVTPAPKAKPGRYDIAVTVQPVDAEGKPNDKPLVRKLAVTLHNLVIRPREDFYVTHWFYVDQLIDWYKTNLFDKRLWEVLAAYFRDIAEHGQNTIYVPVFTASTDGVKRPSQLLRVTDKGNGKYAFDWTDVRRYIRLARECGITHFEWCHLFTQWGVRNAIRIYEGQGADEKLLWPPETPATSDVYRNFLRQFLLALKRFVEREGILENSFFHVSDEPHGEEPLANYKAARAMLRELAPWMKCMDACSQIEFGRQKLMDLPVPSISTALDFYKEGIESGCYYCCGPRGEFLNHLMDTPLAKIAMHGFLFYHWPFKGFLHWGFNYWCVSQHRELIDPFTVSDGTRWPGWAYGDTFLVYPGENGPVDSIRWEVFAEAMQDYALLQTLGLDRDDKLLSKLVSFHEFPKDAAWRIAAKKKLYKLADTKGKA